MPYDVEPFVLGWRLEVRSDRIELSVRSPGRPGRQSLAPLPQLQLAAIIRNVYEVQLVRNAGALKKLPKPLALGSSVTRKVENDSDTPQQKIMNVKRQGIFHSTGVLDEVFDIPNLPRIQSIKEFVLNEQNGVLRPRQLPRICRLSSGHLATHEIQFRPLNVHAGNDDVEQRAAPIHIEAKSSPPLLSHRQHRRGVLTAHHPVAALAMLAT